MIAVFLFFLSNASAHKCSYKYKGLRARTYNKKKARACAGKEELIIASISAIRCCYVGRAIFVESEVKRCTSFNIPSVYGLMRVPRVRVMRAYYNMFMHAVNMRTKGMYS